MKNIFRIGLAVALAGGIGSSPANAQKAPRPARTTTCDNAVNTWFKNAADYLQHGQVSPGKQPALYATVSLVSHAKPTTLAGKKPDRTALWYAHGEVTQVNFPVTVSFEGKLPLWINNGDGNTPFNGGQNNTLNVVLNDSGSQSFNWQVDGRNRLGKGPQPFALNAQTAQMTPDFLLYTGSLNFHGMKDITLTLVRGEKDGAPAPKPQPVGARYRVTPSFIVTNSSDGPGDNSVEVFGLVRFLVKNTEYPAFDFKGSRSKNGRFDGTPFELESRFNDPSSNGLIIAGVVFDADTLSSDDDMWRQKKKTLPLEFYSKSKNGGVTVDPGKAFADDEAQGNLFLRIEKIGDVY